MKCCETSLGLPCTLNLFTAVTNDKLVFLTVSHFYPSLTFAERKSLPIEWSNIRVCTQVGSRLEVTNGMEINKTVKSFITLSPGYDNLAFILKGGVFNYNKLT